MRWAKDRHLVQNTPPAVQGGGLGAWGGGQVVQKMNAVSLEARTVRIRRAETELRRSRSPGCRQTGRTFPQFLPWSGVCPGGRQNGHRKLCALWRRLIRCLLLKQVVKEPIARQQHNAFGRIKWLWMQHSSWLHSCECRRRATAASDQRVHSTSNN